MKYQTLVERIIPMMGDKELNCRQLELLYNSKYRNSVNSRQVTNILGSSKKFEKVGFDHVQVAFSKYKRKVIVWKVKPQFLEVKE
jgi:hypothetical protein